ncbi:hypothetical protein M0811_07065 [Anaeramoeba ignava]|uniref:Uncharacterized protein n=1 Tax=Anaeramoeba ignava TaxID=1746090 RepID=A0A9Q0LPF0_ANAIG|nr:hypothetical protein M0811_07065 [Anaeramoeba ignava]
MMNKKDEKNESTNKEVESILTNQLPEKQNQEDDLKRKHNKTPEITPVKNLQPPQKKYFNKEDEYISDEQESSDEVDKKTPNKNESKKSKQRSKKKKRDKKRKEIKKKKSNL